MVQREHWDAEAPPLLELSAEIELSSILTVHGALKIGDTGTLFFTPALDARLMGLLPLELPLKSVSGLARSHQGRRVMVQAEHPLTLRGPGGYQTWLAIQVLRDCTQGPVPPLLLSAKRQNVFGELSGLLGIGRHGFGFAAAESRLFGALSTVWEDFASLEQLWALPGELHIQVGGRSYVFQTEEAEALLLQLRRRWLGQALSRPGHWPAIRRVGAGLQCGNLTLGPRGLYFLPREAPARLLAARGIRIHVEEEEDHVRMSDDGQKWATFWVDDVSATATALRTELLAPAWLREAKGVGDLSSLRGSCRVQVNVGACQTCQQVDLQGADGRLYFTLQSTETVSPWTVGTIEIFGAGGHTRVDGWVVSWEPKEVGQVLVNFCASAALKDLDQRAHYRLPLEDRLGRFAVVEGRGHRRIDGGMLLDLSRGGAGLWIKSELPIGSRVELGMQVERTDGIRKRIETFPLKGVVVHSRPAPYNGGEGWKVGIRFDRLEIAAFDARQRAWLRTRCTPAAEK